MPSCFPAFFASKKRNEDGSSIKSKNKKRGRALSNLSNDQVPESSASTLSNDSLLPNNVSNNSIKTNPQSSISNNNSTNNNDNVTHTYSKEIITIPEYSPLKSEPQMSLYSDRETIDRLNAELKLSQSELKSAQLKLTIATEKNEQLLRQQNNQKLELKKKQAELDDAEKRIAELIKKDKDLEEINRQVKSQLKASKLEPEIEALLTGLAYSLKDAYEQIEDYKEKEKDLLIMANETGEEIRRLQLKQKDSNLLATECGQELCDVKCDLENAFKYINELKSQIDNSEKIIVGLVNELKAANSDYENLERENTDLTTFANETGDEIVHLRSINKDQTFLINEVGQEFLEAKREIENLKKENNALCLLLNGLGEECIKSRNRVHDLEDVENDLLLLANESGEEIVSLRSKIKDNNLLVNELGNELLETKEKATHYKKCANLFIDLINVLSKEYAATEKDKEYLENEKDDLLIMASETGEEIINVRKKLRDDKILINECTTELIQEKAKNEQLKRENEIQEKLLEGLANMLNEANIELEKSKAREQDMELLANECGQEICELREQIKQIMPKPNSQKIIC